MKKWSIPKIGYLIIFVIAIIGIFVVLKSLLSGLWVNKDQHYLLTIPQFTSFQDTINAYPAFGSKDDKAKIKNLLSSEYLHLRSPKSMTCPQTDMQYQHAATLFHDQRWHEAKIAFSALLNKDYSLQQVCITYNLAQIEKQLKNSRAAKRLFVRTSALVARGDAPDPLHLGISSYGEVAGLLLDDIGQRKLLPNGKMLWIVGAYNNGANSLPFEGFEEDSVSVLENILRLYIKQANLGDAQAYDSIATVIEGLIDPSNKNAKLLFEKAILRDNIRKLVFAYIFNANDDMYHLHNQAIKQNILQLFKKIERENLDLQGDDRYIAIFAYQNGDIALAKQLANYDWVKNHNALSVWILAKIALNEKKPELAKAYYQHAITHLSDSNVSETLSKRIQQEQKKLLEIYQVAQ